MKTLFLTAIVSFSIAAAAEPVMPLEDVLGHSVSTGEGFRSIELSREAVDLEIEARDFELTPRLSSELSQIEDRRATFNPGRRSISRLLDVTLAKPFSTGTSVSLRTGYEVAEVAAVGSRHIANWELTLSQALWRNGFGRATALRREADEFERQARNYDLLQQRQQLLVEIESSYWDLALALREREIREENLKRGDALEKWVQKRFRNSAAENTDVYQVQSLLAARRLALIEVKNRIEALYTRVGQLVPGLKASTWRPDVAALETMRDSTGLLAPRASARKPDSVPVRLDALASRERAQQARETSQRQEDTLRPQLDLAVTHGRNGIRGTVGDAWTDAFGNNSTYTKVGFVFSMELDGVAKDHLQRAAALRAEASDLDARRLARESDLAWGELLRRIETFRVSVAAARSAANAQEQKIQEERRRYEQGRSTAFQTIAFEVEAAEAELAVYRLLAELRKGEAQARLYAQDDGGAR